MSYCWVAFYTYTVKKGLRHSRPQPGCHLTNYPWAEIFKLFPPRESLVSNIPAGDGNVANIFLQCMFPPLCTTSPFHLIFAQSTPPDHTSLFNLFLYENFVEFLFFANLTFHHKHRKFGNSTQILRFPLVRWACLIK
jgi:hypothetical protein